MKQATRIIKARETLDIIENGRYTANGHEVDVRQDIDHAMATADLYTEDGFEEVMKSADQKIALLKVNTKIIVENTSVLDGASRLVQACERVGCLNFASAKNPGGGFLNGAIAQEESLAMSSILYGTQMKHHKMYDYNRGRHTYLYSDYMIYSPDVVVFRDNDGELLTQPYKLSIITSPAVNVGAILNNRPEEMEHLESTMLRRMDKVLALFVAHDIKHLLLGAWGCGVFRNNPADIARWFAHYLTNDGKYASCFDTVFFAVYDRSKNEENINAFRQQFNQL